jgi:serine/threonine protein kinase
MERGEGVLNDSQGEPEQVIVTDDELKRHRHLHVPHPETRILPQHFEPMQFLGSGTFAEVYLVRKKSSGIYYAMKV